MDATDQTQPLIEVNSVSKRFCRNLKRSLLYGVADVSRELIGLNAHSGQLRKEEFMATNKVSFSVHRGECVGLIGKNGAGKTTLLKLINGLIKPDAGSITARGRVAALIALGAGFNPILTGRENIYINGSVLGLTRSEIKDKIDEIIEFSEIPEFIDAPVQSYSSGMVVRLGFSIATALKPDVLLLDEVLAVGDVSFFSKCLKRIGDLLEDTAVIFVSHNNAQIERICNRCVYLKRGSVIMEGSTSEVLKHYHEDTRQEAKVLKASLYGGVGAFELNLESDSFEMGDAITFSLGFESDRMVEFGDAEMNIRRNGTAVAHTNFKDLLTSIPKGRSEFSFKTNKLSIAEGEYTVSFFVMDKEKKNPIISGFDICRFQVSGGKRSGPAHQFELIKA